jgi:hypothetical protein
VITILDVAIAHGARADAAGGYSGAEFARLGLPMLAGCQRCGAALAAYNAYPTRSGFTGCAECTSPEDGFSTVSRFDLFCRKGQS